jgi:hypothetical protein
MLKSNRLIVVLFLLIALTAMSVPAQTTNSSITGRVIDTKDAHVPGANVSHANHPAVQ